MDLSIFLAKLLGIYMLIIAADLLLRRREFEGVIKNSASSKGLLVLSGSSSLLLGLAIVIAQPMYEFDWQGLITLIGYLLILRGIVRFAFPSFVQKKMVPLFIQGHWIVFAILVIVGGFLTYNGFSQ